MRIACIATNWFEDSELTEPIKAMTAAGHQVDLISFKKEPIEGKRHKVKVTPDRTISEARVEDYDALFVPGGFSPDQLRADVRFVRFCEAFDDAVKPIFALCHGPQILLAADVLEGRRCTAWKTVQDDLRRAGIDVVDEPVVIDGSLVTSRQPSDLAAFNAAVLRVLASEERRSSDARGASPEARV